MGSLTTAEILQYVQNGGVLGLLAFIIVAGFKGWLIFGRELTSCRTQADTAVAAVRAERDEWKAIALRGMEATEKALDQARIAALVTPRPAAGP